MGLVQQGERSIRKVASSMAAARARWLGKAGQLVAPAWRPLRRAGSAISRFFSHPLVQKALHIVSILAILLSFTAYMAAWLDFNGPMLTDPDLQSDDARTSIFPFHRYDSDPSLEGDPIADEMLSLVPSGVWLLYRILVPLSDVFIAPKIVQAIAFLVLAAAGVVLWRARRAGLGAGLLLVFFICHDWFAVERIAGGLGRAFGFPCFALWLAGVLAKNRWARFGAPVIGAVTYPSVMAMLLAAEGLYAVRDLTKVKASVFWGRLRRYALLVGISVLAVLPSLLGSDDRGPFFTLEQAKLEPAFSRAGRLWILPFAEPSKVFLDTYLDPLTPHGESPLPRLKHAFEANAESWATAFIGLLLLAGLLRLGPRPSVAIAFTCGTVILYLLSRLLAFQLYSPERYYSFGMRMALYALLVSVPAGLCSTLRRRPRAISRNFMAAGLLLLVWTCTGDGQKKPSGMFISADQDRPLYDFIRTLPKDVRIASHPLDGDGIPYFGARATMGTFETLQPWFVDSWRRQKRRCEATLRALYATNRKEVLDYAAKYGVTHFLINRSRYRSNFVGKSSSFQPFSSYSRALLARTKLKDLVMAHVPESAIVYQYHNWQVVDVARLAQAWH